MAGLNECGSEIRWIQDLLEELKDRQLSTDFFLGLMHDLTDMMVEGEAAEEDIDLPPIQPGQVLYTTFHNFQTTVYCHCYQRFGSASIIFRMRIQVQVAVFGMWIQIDSSLQKPVLFLQNLYSPLLSTGNVFRV